MSLTLCCQFLEPVKKLSVDGSIIYENSIKEKHLQLSQYKQGKYSEQTIQNVYRNNVQELVNLVPKLVSNNIESFRMSSGVLPLFEFCHQLATTDTILINLFQKLGTEFKKHNIRVSCHPGQFTVISSNDNKVIQNAIKELEYHAWMFDAMNLDQTTQYPINIHGGKTGNHNIAIETIKSLPNNVRNRLTLENDESSYNILDLLKIHEQTNITITFDSHHHSFNNGDMTVLDAVEQSIKTWNNIKPVQHLSNTEPGLENSSFTNRRKHSFYINNIPKLQLELIKHNLIDLDVAHLSRPKVLLSSVFGDAFR